MLKYSASKQYAKKLIQETNGAFFSITKEDHTKVTCRTVKEDGIKTGGGVLVSVMGKGKGNTEIVHVPLIKAVKIKGIEYHILN